MIIKEWSLRTRNFKITPLKEEASVIEGIADSCYLPKGLSKYQPLISIPLPYLDMILLYYYYNSIFHIIRTLIYSIGDYKYR